MSIQYEKDRYLRHRLLYLLAYINYIYLRSAYIAVRVIDIFKIPQW